MNGNTKSTISRRTVVAAAAWTTPLIAASVATPAMAASVPTPPPALLSYSQALSNIPACGTVPTGELLLTDDQSIPLAGATVSVTLPLGLAWSDGSTGTKVMTTSGAGKIALGGQVVSTGRAGTFEVDASATSVVSNQASGKFAVSATVGTLYFSTNQKTSTNSDPTGVVADARDIVIATNYMYVVNSTGDWFLKSGTGNVSPYQQITGVGPVDSIWGGTGSDYGYAVSGGQVYRTKYTTTATLVPGVSNVVKIATAGSRVFALTASGTVYQSTDTGSSFTQVMMKSNPTQPFTGVKDIQGAQGGGFGWASAGTDVYYIDTNGQANLSTSSTPKPSNPATLAVGSNYAFVIDADGSVWSGRNSTWKKMTNLSGKATFIQSARNSDWLWVLTEAGDVMWSSDQSKFYTSGLSSRVGKAKQLWISTSYAVIITENNQWWQHAGGSTSDNWTQITGTPNNTVLRIASNFGDNLWAVAAQNQVCAI